MARTVKDIVAEVIRSGRPVDIGGRSVVPQTREDVHEWLAGKGVDSNSEAQMSTVIPEPTAGLERAYDPAYTEVSGPTAEETASYGRARAAATQAVEGLGMPTPQEMFTPRPVPAGFLGARDPTPYNEYVAGLTPERQAIEAERLNPPSEAPGAFGRLVQDVGSVAAGSVMGSPLPGFKPVEQAARGVAEAGVDFAGGVASGVGNLAGIAGGLGARLGHTAIAEIADFHTDHFAPRPSADATEAQHAKFAAREAENAALFADVRSGLDKAYGHMEEVAQSRMDADTISNTRADIADVMSVVPLLAEMVFDIPEEELSERDVWERLRMSFSRGLGSANLLSDSALAGLAYVVTNPMKALHTMPFTTLLTFADVAAAMTKAGGGLANSARGRAALRKLETLTDKHLPRMGDAIATARRGGEVWSQAFGDAADNINNTARLFGDAVVRQAPRAGRGAASQFDAMGRAMVHKADDGAYTSGADTGKGGWDTAFEEFDKSVGQDGVIEQPREMAKSEIEAGTAQHESLKGDDPIGTKGGARIRGGRVERKRLWGEVDKIRDELMNSLVVRSQSGKKSYRAKEIDRAISEALSFAIPNTILMSKAVRTRVVADMRSWAGNKAIHGDAALSGKALDTFAKQLEAEVLGMASRDMREVKGVTGSNRVYNLKLKMGDWDGGTFNVVDDSLLRMASDEKLRDFRREVYVESLQAVAGRAGQRVEQGNRQLAIVHALEDHAPRAYKSSKAKGGGREFAQAPSVVHELARIDKALAADGHLPAAFRVDGSVLAAELRKLHEGKDTIHGISAKRVYRDLEGYTPLSKAKGGEVTQVELGLKKSTSGEARAVRLDPLNIEGGVYVNPGTHGTLRWWAADSSSRRVADGMMELSRFLKSNITARNPTTHVNNIASNVVVQTLRRGDPLMPARVIKIGYEYKQYLGGKMPVGPKRDMYRAIERTGGIKTDMVTSELKALGKADELSNKGIPGTQTMERVYAWEDNIFKLEEAVHNYTAIEKKMAALEGGGWVELAVSKGRTVRVRKRSDGKWRVSEVGRGGGVRPPPGAKLTAVVDKAAKRRRVEVADAPTGHSYAVTASKLNDLVANASMKPALDLFFDYSDVSKIAQILRSNPEFAAFAAPFYSWYSKAMTMPGAQRGLIGHMMGVPLLRTSDYLLAAKQLRSATLASARRSMVANSMRHEFVENRSDMAAALSGEGWKRIPSLMAPIMESSNPLYFGFKSLEYMSPSQPADALLRLVFHGAGTVSLPAISDAVMRGGAFTSEGREGLAGAFMSTSAFPPNDDDLDKLPPRQAERLKRLRNVWRRHATAPEGLPLVDALELMGASGGIITELVSVASDKNAPAWKRDRLYDSFTALLLPGLYAKAFDVSAGAAYQFATNPSISEGLGAFSSVRHGDFGPPELAMVQKGHIPPDKGTRQFIRWAVRRLIGLGMRPVMVTDDLRVDRAKAAAGAVDYWAVHEKGRVSKSVDKLGKALRESMAEPLRDVMKGHHKRWVDSGEEAGWLDKFEDAYRELESRDGTDSARATYIKYMRHAPPLMKDSDGKVVKTKGLIKEELEAIKERMMEPFDAVMGLKDISKTSFPD